MGAMSPAHHSQNVDKDALNEQSLAQQLRGLWRLKPYLWPDGNLGFKLRSFAAIVLTIFGKIVLVGSPFLFGWAVDAVNMAAKSDTPWTQAWTGIIGFAIGYGLLKLFAVLVTEGREYLFAPVAQFAQRSVATASFAHLHRLSLRFHLEKRTGGLSRIIERGVRSIDFLFRFLLFNVGPTFLELGIAATVFWFAYNGWFSLIAAVIVLSYIAFTVTTTEWRLKFRREMNKRDTEAAGKAVDSLLNYETVKYFSAEGFETSRYDGAMEGYQRAAIRSRTSLATVNIGQSFLMNLGLVLMISLSGYYIVKGEMSVL